MTLLLIPVLTCNGVHAGEVCDAELGGDPEVIPARVLAQAVAAGWQITPGGRHLCPGCKTNPDMPEEGSR